MHPIINLLKEHGYRLIDRGENFSCAAKYRGGKRETSLSVNKRKGVWYDFVAEIGGKPEDLALLVEGKITRFEDWSADVEVCDKYKITKRMNNEILDALIPDWDFFTKRGISDETMKKFEAGFCMAYQMRKRIIFPIRDRSGKDIIGFVGRWFSEEIPDGVAKWKILGGKKNFLACLWLNEAEIRKSKRIIIIESYGDLLSLWEAGIKVGFCIFGLNISPKQVSAIVGLDPNEIIIATNRDEDESKGQAAALKIRSKLENFFDSSKIEIRLPTEKDIQKMKLKDIKNHYA